MDTSHESADTATITSTVSTSNQINQSAISDLSMDIEDNSINSHLDEEAQPDSTSNDSLEGAVGNVKENYSGNTLSAVKSRKLRFQCLVCNHVFKFYNSFYSHFNVKHAAERRSSINGSNRHDTRKFYKKISADAPVLPIGLKHKSSLPPTVAASVNLLATKSSDAKLYICATCKYVTVYKSRFTAHCTSKHPWTKHGRELHKEAIKSGIPIMSTKAKVLLEKMYKFNLHGFKKQAGRILKSYHSLPSSNVQMKVKLGSPSLSPKSTSKSMNLFCIMCFIKFPSMNELKWHYRQKHSKTTPKEDKYTGQYNCRICTNSSTSIKGIATHYARRHSIGAYYSWAFPELQMRFQQIQAQGTNTTDNINPVALSNSDFMEVDKQMNHDASTNRKQVQSDVFFDICSRDTVVWHPSDSKKYLSEKPLSCHICEYTSQNILELLNHCKNTHNDRYPSGIRRAVKKKFKKVIKVLPYDSSMGHLFTKHNGAWVDENNVFLKEVEFPCYECPEKFKSMNLVYDHFCATHTESEFEISKVKACESDGLKENVSVASEQKHSEQVHLLTCEHCEFACNKKGSMQAHYKEKHEDKTYSFSKVSKFNMSQIVVYKCKFCPYEGKLADIKSHLVNKHSEFENVNVKLLSTYFSTDKLAMKPISCMDCNFHTIFKNSLLEHYGTEHRHQAITFLEDENLKGYHQCLFCNMKMHESTLLSHHYIHWKQQSVVKAKDQETKLGKCFVCSICNQAFKDKGILWQHISFTHSKFRNFISVKVFKKANQATPLNTLLESTLASITGPDNTISNKKENDSKDAYVQLKSTKYVASRFSKHFLEVSNHSKFVAYQCIHCKSLLKNKQLALNHLRTARTGTKKHTIDNCHFIPYVCCRFCSFISCHVHNFVRHLTRHFKQSMFDCVKCDERFSSANAVQEHLLSQHGLRIHSQIIYNILPSTCELDENDQFKCSFCVSNNLVFPNLDDLSKHFFKCHVKNSNVDEAKNIYDQSETEHTEETKKFVVEDACSYDEHESSSKEIWSNLEIHAAIEHFVHKPIACHFCRLAFICSSKYVNHLTQNHGVHVKKLKPSYLKLPKDRTIVHKMLEEMIEKRKATGRATIPGAIYDTDLWSCTKCTKSSTSITELQAHYETEHNCNSLYICFNCEYVSHSTENMDSHCTKIHEIKKSRPSIPLGVIPSLPDREVMDNDSTPTTPMKPMPKEPLPQNKYISSDTMIARKTIKRTAKSIRDRWATINGISKCLSCDFSCADQSRMQSHVLTTHRKKSQYVCQFCDYISSSFESIDQHLESYHKIKKNSHIGLKIDYDVSDVNLKPVNWKELLEARKQFIYTPMPTLPVVTPLHSRLSRQSSKSSDSSQAASVKDEIPPLERSKSNTAIAEIKTSKSRSESPVQIQDNSSNQSSTNDNASSSSNRAAQKAKNVFQCMYCGFVEKSTYALEAHLQRHESDYPTTDGFDDIGYSMAKLGIVRKMTY